MDQHRYWGGNHTDRWPYRSCEEETTETQLATTTAKPGMVAASDVVGCPKSQFQIVRKAPGNGANEPNLGAGTGLIAEQERGPSRSIGHFQQVRAVAPLTRRAESSLSDNVAPQTGLERMT